MLERVIDALENTPAIEGLWVSIDAPGLLEDAGRLGTRVASGRLNVLPSEASPSASAIAGIDRMGTARPLLLTTADNALLDTAMLEYFLAAAEESDADLAVGVVTEEVVRSRFPDSRRTYFRFRGGGVSGANLYALRTPAARRAVEFWRRAERHRKRPWRLVSAFGPISLLLFALGRLDLDEALARASGVIGARCAAVRMPQPEAALDVDRLPDYEQVVQILAERRAREGAPEEPGR